MFGESTTENGAMDHLVVVAYPEPLPIEARSLEHEAVPGGSIGLGYYYSGHLIARGIVSPDAAQAIRQILQKPTPVALAATEDDDGNIDARICLVLPMDADPFRQDETDLEDEPWKASVPPPPPEIEQSYHPEDGGETPRLALLPIGNAVRGAGERRHPGDVAGDAREMLENLLAGRAQDAVSRAIDELLDSI